MKKILIFFILLPALLYSQQTEIKAIKAGMPGPKIVLPDSGNEYVYLSDYCGKKLRKPYINKTKHVVVLSFFATWCKPCIAEIPHLQKIKHKFKGYPIKFFLINVGEETEKVQKFLKDRNVKLDVLYDRFKMTAEKYDALRLPRLIILDKNGIIRLEKRGFKNPDSFKLELENVISELLDE